MSEHAIEIQPSEQLSLGSQAPVVRMLQAVLEKGVTADSVGAVERLVDLYERMAAKEAEKQFAVAFIELRKELPKIFADRTVPDKFGNEKFRFAAYEDIMQAVDPLLLKHGFTVTFSSEIKEDRITQTCILTHIGGHTRTNQFMARIGSGPPGASPTQADGAASTYAKRFALCAALNIVIERDREGVEQDARKEGEPISDDKAAYLRELVHETKSNEEAFLKYAGASTYEEIGSVKYDMLVNSLLKKQRR
jgi:hypothetical protein